MSAIDTLRAYLPDDHHHLCATQHPGKGGGECDCYARRTAAERAAVAAVEELLEAAEPALDLLAVEGYDRHFETGAPVCAEYERLAVAVRRVKGEA